MSSAVHLCPFEVHAVVKARPHHVNVSNKACDVQRCPSTRLRRLVDVGPAIAKKRRRVNVTALAREEKCCRAVRPRMVDVDAAAVAK